MATHTFEPDKIITQPVVVQSIRSGCQEDLILNLTLLASAGVAHNGTGGRVECVFGLVGTRQELMVWVPGNASGAYQLTVPGVATAALSGEYDYSILYRPATGAPITLYRGVLTITGYATGPLDLTPATVPTTPLPLVQTIEIAGVLDLPGNTTPLPEVPPVRAPHLLPITLVATVAQLQGATADPGATCVVYVMRNGLPLGLPIIGAQTDTGVFAATIDNVTQSLASAGDTIKTTLCIQRTGDSRAWEAHAPASITLEAVGAPVSRTPVITMDPLPASVPPGALILTGTISDDNIIANDDFSVTFDGAAQSGTFSSANGQWTATIQLTTLGAKTISVTATDPFQLTATATGTTTCAMPTGEITSHADGDAWDTAPIPVTAAFSPAPANGTSLAFRVGGVTAATGTFTNGIASATIGAQSAGSHAIVARLVTPAGNADTPAVNLTVSDLSPTATITSHSAGDEVTIGNPTTFTADVVAPPGCTIQSVHWRIASGSWVSATHGTGNAWSAPLTFTAEGSVTVTLRVTDTGGTYVENAVSVTGVYEQAPWNDGAISFSGSAYAEVESTAGTTATLTFSTTGATNGATRRVQIPGGYTELLTAIPDGWTITQDASITAPTGGYRVATLPFVPLCAWDALFQVDTVNHIIKWSASRSEVTTTALAEFLDYRWPCNGNGRAYDAAGARVPTMDALVPASGGATPTVPVSDGDTNRFVADPNAALDNADRGQCFMPTGGGSNYPMMLPVAYAGTTWSWCAWIHASELRTYLGTGDEQSGASAILQPMPTWSGAMDAVFCVGHEAFTRAADGLTPMFLGNLWTRTGFTCARSAMFSHTYDGRTHGVNNYSLQQLTGNSAHSTTQYDPWVNVALVKINATTIQIWVNWQLIGTATVSATYSSAAAGFCVGGAAESYYARGPARIKLREICTWDGAWSQEQIAAIARRTMGPIKTARAVTAGPIDHTMCGSSLRNYGNDGTLRTIAPDLRVFGNGVTGAIEASGVAHGGVTLTVIGSWTGTSVVSVARNGIDGVENSGLVIGYPETDYRFRVANGGTIGVEGITIEWSSNNGTDWAAPVALGTANYARIPFGSATAYLSFGAGTLVTGEVIATPASFRNDTDDAIRMQNLISLVCTSDSIVTADYDPGQIMNQGWTPNPVETTIALWYAKPHRTRLLSGAIPLTWNMGGFSMAELDTMPAMRAAQLTAMRQHATQFGWIDIIGGRNGDDSAYSIGLDSTYYGEYPPGANGEAGPHPSHSVVAPHTRTGTQKWEDEVWAAIRRCFRVGVNSNVPWV